MNSSTNSTKSRKINRLKPFLYTKWYFFVTICTENKYKYFGNKSVGEDTILPNKINLNIYGQIIEEYRLQIPKIYQNVSLMDYIIMPNHIHGIVVIDDIIHSNKAINNRPYKNNNLSIIIKWFKQSSSKKLHEIGLTNFKRQRSFYDHIIRNDQDFQRIIEYIIDNPYKRENDEYYIT